MPMTVITTTTHAQLGEEDGLGGGWDDKGPWRVRPLLVEWFEKDLLMQQLAGGTAYSGTFGSGSWTRVLPYQDPEDPTLYVDSIAWRPFGKLLTTFPVISYTYAIVTATFRRPEWNFQPSDDPLNFNSVDPSVVLPPYCSYHLEFGSERINIPNSSVKYLSDGLTVPGTWSKKILTADIQLTFHKYPLSPLPIIRDYADTVNSATFLGCAPETVLFDGGTIDRQPNEDGSTAQDVIINFKWRKIPHNKGPRPDGYTFDYVVDKVTNAKKFDLVDHNLILTYFTPAP